MPWRLKRYISLPSIHPSILTILSFLLSAPSTHRGNGPKMQKTPIVRNSQFTYLTHMHIAEIGNFLFLFFVLLWAPGLLRLHLRLHLQNPW